MFRLMTRIPARKPRRSRRQDSSRRPIYLQLESLEERTLMSATPILAPSASAATNPMASAHAVDLVTVPRQVIPDRLAGSSDSHLYSFRLQQGDFLEADVQTASNLHLAALMSILDSHSNELATIAASPDPATGIMSSNPAYGFRAPATDTYYVRIAGYQPKPAANRNNATQPNGPTPLATSGAYSLELHRLALAQGQQDMATLGQTGAMYAWLNGNTLDISGPTGYGFGIRGNWAQTTSRANNLIASTYAATGTVYLETGLGEIPMPVPGAGTFSVTTKPQVWGDAFGEVDSLNWSATLSVPAIATPFGNTGPFGFDLSASTQQNDHWGLKLGNDQLLQKTGAPLNAAVPYLCLDFTAVSQSAPTIIADPADPFLYVGLTSKGYAIGASMHGLIPFTPVATPSQWSGNLRGHVYAAASFDLTKVMGLPASVDGNLTINLDPNGTGRLLGGASVTASQLVSMLKNPAAASSVAQAVEQAFRNISIGVNGELKVGLKLDVFGVPVQLPQLPVAHASLIYDGPSQSAFFHGGSVNPFAGTVLAPLGSQNTLDIDAAVRPGGLFFVDLKGNYRIGGFPATGHVLIVNSPASGSSQAGSSGLGGIARGLAALATASSPSGSSQLGGTAALATVSSPSGSSQLAQYRAVTALATGSPWDKPSGIYVEEDVSIFGGSVHLQGSVKSNGDFQLVATASENLGPLSGNASFTLSYTHAQGYQFTADLYAHVDTQYVRADLTVHFFFGVDTSGHITYAASGTASVDVYAPNHGWQAWDWEWQHVADVGVGVSNDALWFSADGYRVTIYLPH